MWKIVVAPGDFTNDGHVVPSEDTKEHDISTTCWCKPDVEQVEGGLVITHKKITH